MAGGDGADDLNSERMEAEISVRDRSHQSVGSALPLTLRQVQVLQCVEQYLEARGYPPTVRELAGMLGVTSTNGVKDHLRGLERKGFLVSAPSTARGLRVLRPSTSATIVAPRPLAKCPHCGCFSRFVGGV